MAALKPGQQAPSFELRDLDGKTRSLKELIRGGAGLLVFYHRECPVCQFSMPFVDAIARAVNSAKVRAWGVSQDAEDESEEFARQKHLRLPILVDEPPHPVSNAYGITNVPTLFVIDSGGRITHNCVGFSKADFLEIAAYLAREASVKPPDIFAGRSDIPALKPG